MVQVNGHGGRCCGARHLRGFGDAENRNPDLINDALADVPPERMTEVILNGTQVRSYPAVLERLANLGFVLDGHWINGNHGSHNYRFSRCDNRLPLDLAGWNGMVMSAGLHGRLPEVRLGRGGARQRANNHTPYIHPLPDWQRNDATVRHRYLAQIVVMRNGNRGIQAGARYRINSPRSRYHNQEFIALGQGGGGWDRNYTIAFRDGATGIRFEISAANCVRVDGVPPEIPPGSNMREYVVGDRVQVVNTWGEYGRGLVGTVTAVINPTLVTIQFDTPNTATTNSATNYITIVDFDRQPDVPRTRPAAPRAPAERPVDPPQRHEEGPAPRGRGAAAVPPPPAPAAPPPARVILSTYHNVFRDGRRGAGYDTYNEAWENRGRRTRVDRRDIMSNGDIVWNENIHED